MLGNTNAKIGGITGIGLINTCNIGNLTNNNGIFSGFNDSNYLLSSMTTTSSFTTLKIIIKANSSSFNTHNTLLGKFSYSTWEPWVGVQNNGYPSFYTGNWIQGTTILNVNTNYWFCIDFDGTYYNYYTLEDNNYTLNNLPSLNNWIYQCKTDDNFLNSILYIGKDRWGDGEYWKGNIDLKQSCIVLDGIVKPYYI